MKERDEVFYRLAQKEGIFNQKTNLLDFGCGLGIVMNQYNQWGIPAESITGVDISKKRIETGKKQFPHFTFDIIDKNLPFKDNQFSLVLVYTVFSSIIDQTKRMHWALELDRVLKPCGKIFFYDMIVDNPFNNSVKKISPNDLSQFFTNYSISATSLTIWPHLVRSISFCSNLVYPFLAKINLLHTHLAVVLTKPSRYN